MRSKLFLAQLAKLIVQLVSVPSRRRISRSAEFWPAAKIRRKKYGRRKRRQNLESRSAAEKNPAKFGSV